MMVVKDQVSSVDELVMFAKFSMLPFRLPRGDVKKRLNSPC